MTKYGKSPWVERTPASRVPAYPRQRGKAEVDVAIVGGGLTGCATAYAFAAAGLNVVLLEAGRVGAGNTGSSLGWIADAPVASIADLEKAIGSAPTKRACQAWRRAALDFAALLRRLDIPCQLQPQSSLLVATTPEQTVALARERKSRQAAGLDAPLLNARALKSDTGLDGPGAIRQKDGTLIDPYRACLGLAAAAVERGARIFEQSPATRVTFGRKHVDVLTKNGSIRADQVIVATGAPTPLFRALIRHFWYHATYLALTEPIPAKIRQLLGGRAAVLRDLAAPSHIVRWVDDQRLLVSGADTALPPERLRSKLAVQKTGQLMYELSTLYPDISGVMPAFGWGASYARTEDGLPYIGPHRNFPRHLFAFGDSSRSVTGAYLASRVLLRQYLEEPEPNDAPFEFARHGR